MIKKKIKKDKNTNDDVKPKIIRFKDYPKFTPNLTPRQIFLLGSFGGTYWRPIYSNITKINAYYILSFYTESSCTGINSNFLGGFTTFWSETATRALSIIR